MGFEPFMYKGLETGSRQVAAHAVRQNDVSLSVRLTVCLKLFVCVCVCVHVCGVNACVFLISLID